MNQETMARDGRQQHKKEEEVYSNKYLTLGEWFIFIN